VAVLGCSGVGYGVGTVGDVDVPSSASVPLVRPEPTWTRITNIDIEASITGAVAVAQFWVPPPPKPSPPGVLPPAAVTALDGECILWGADFCLGRRRTTY
jgi:hypothetical protein